MTLVATAEQLAAGRPVLVGSDDDTTVFVAAAAGAVDAGALGRLHELGRGIVVLGLADAVADRLALAAVGSRGPRRIDLPFTAPIDAAAGLDGGWSLADRARTMRLAADPATRASDLTSPGHVHPARIGDGGPDGGAPAAALELARVAELAPAVILATVVDGAGRPARLADARGDRDLGRLPVASSTALHTLAQARRVGELAAACALPTRHGAFRAAAHANTGTGGATMALVHGDPAARAAPLVHLHSGCLLGDVLRSQLCRCRHDLEAAIGAILAEGAGVLVYTKPSATAALVCGAGQPGDAAVAAGLLRRAGVTRLRLAGGDPPAEAALRALGLDVIPAGLEAAA